MGKNPYIKASRCLSDAKAKQSVTKPLKQQKKKERKKSSAGGPSTFVLFYKSSFFPLTRQKEVNGEMCVALGPPADIQLHLQATRCQFSEVKRVMPLEVHSDHCLNMEKKNETDPACEHLQQH